MKARLSRSEWQLLLIMSCMQFTHIVDFMIIMPLGPQLMRLFAISPQQFSMLVSSYTIAAGCSALLGASFIDRFDRKRILLFFFACFLLGTLWCGLAHSYVQLCLARITAGAFGGMLTSIVFSVIGDVFPYERRARAMGLIMTAFSVASIAGVPLGLALANRFGWSFPFLALVGLGIAVFVLASICIPGMRGHMQESALVHKSPMRTLKAALSDGNQRTALSVGALLMFSQFSLIPFISPSMVANFGMAEANLPLVYLCGGLASFFSLPWIGRMADYYGKPRIFFIFTLATLPAIALLTQLGPTPLLPALILTSCFFIASSGRSVPASAMLTAAVPAAQRGSFMSLVSAAQQFSAGIGSSISGAIIVKSGSGSLLHYDIVGYISIATAILAAYAANKVAVVADR